MLEGYARQLASKPRWRPKAKAPLWVASISGTAAAAEAAVCWFQLEEDARVVLVTLVSAVEPCLGRLNSKLCDEDPQKAHSRLSCGWSS